MILSVIWMLCMSVEICRSTGKHTLRCEDLQPGQYYCADPEIDEETQQAKNCSEENNVEVVCYPVKGINCSGIHHTGKTEGFKKMVSCKWTSGKKFSVALLLSIFLGWCGIDRFYLGYPAIGLVKFCTVGFMMLGSFIDVLLIATQVYMTFHKTVKPVMVVRPSDGSAYIVDYYGQGLIRINPDNYTYIKPPDYS